MTYFNAYKHLNSESKVKISLEEIAPLVVQMNYGVHRLVCALVEEMEKNGERDGLVKALKRAVEENTI